MKVCLLKPWSGFSFLSRMGFTVFLCSYINHPRHHRYGAPFIGSILLTNTCVGDVEYCVQDCIFRRGSTSIAPSSAAHPVVTINLASAARFTSALIACTFVSQNKNSLLKCMKCKFEPCDWLGFCRPPWLERL